MRNLNNYADYQIEDIFIRIGYINEVIISINFIDSLFYNDKSNLSDLVYHQIREYFLGKRKTFDFNYQITGTDFQQKVYRYLIKIPYGETRSYKEIAEAIGNKKAYRAVGLANSKNKLLIVIPCHRVINHNSKLSGYNAGVTRKKRLLDIEKKN